MNYATKQKIKSIFSSCGGFYLLNALTNHVPKILMYHRFSRDEESDGIVSKESFERQIIKIKNNFNPISLTDLLSRINQGKSINRNSIAITIDDGYQDFYEYAYPILKKYSVPATIYVTYEFIEKKIWLWPDLIEYALENNSENEINIKINGQYHVLDISDELHKNKTWGLLIDYLTNIPNEKKWEFIKEIFNVLDLQKPDDIPDKYKPLSWAQLIEMSSNGIEIGAHTCTHPILSQLKEQNLNYEISDCRILLQKKLGLNIDHFCYPNGTSKDLNENVKKIIIQAGYDSAAVAYHDKYVLDDIYELRRYAVGNNYFKFKEIIYGMQYISDKYIS